MSLRTFQPGDEAAKVSIYNEAAADLPKFKPATLDEVRRRCLAKEFDKSSILLAFEGNQAVGYASFSANGRVSYPWCRKGHESMAEPLLQAVFDAMKERGLATAFAAYRSDWPAVKDFFLAHGFSQAREMVNYILDLAEMPTPAAMPGSAMSSLSPDDLSDVMALAPLAIRVESRDALEKHLLQNVYFKASDVFVLRDRTTKKALGVGLLIENAAYGDPRAVDSNMPCFRLGAFGTEGMAVKRINGMFSFLVKPDRDANRLGLELMGHAARRLDASDVATFAAQVPTDVPHLARFYHQYFRRQGSFPVFERRL
ncbi:MAG: GNAT family N-acetyltransferase [Gemmataceae bacterium]